MNRKRETREQSNNLVTRFTNRPTTQFYKWQQNLSTLASIVFTAFREWQETARALEPQQRYHQQGAHHIHMQTKANVHGKEDLADYQIDCH